MNLFDSPAYTLSWCVFHVHLQIMCILQFLSFVFYKSQLNTVLSRSCGFLLNFCVSFLSATYRKVLKFLTMIVDLSTESFHCVGFMYSEPGTKYMCMCNDYIFLINGPCYEMSLLISGRILCPEIYYV